MDSFPNCLILMTYKHVENVLFLVCFSCNLFSFVYELNIKYLLECLLQLLSHFFDFQIPQIIDKSSFGVHESLGSKIVAATLRQTDIVDNNFSRLLPNQYTFHQHFWFVFYILFPFIFMLFIWGPV